MVCRHLLPLTICREQSTFVISGRHIANLTACWHLGEQPFNQEINDNFLNDVLSCSKKIGIFLGDG